MMPKDKKPGFQYRLFREGMGIGATLERHILDHFSTTKETEAPSEQDFVLTS